MRAYWDTPEANAKLASERAEQIKREREGERLRRRELKTKRELLLKIIAAGYRQVAKEFHPDTGGSSDAMVRLTQMREILEKLVANNFC
jgi:hypothetical protein